MWDKVGSGWPRSAQALGGRPSHQPPYNDGKYGNNNQFQSVHGLPPLLDD